VNNQPHYDELFLIIHLRPAITCSERGASPAQEKTASRHARDSVEVVARSHDRIFRARELLAVEPEVSLTRLAREAGLPPATFLRNFRKQFGCTPRVYATARRIAAAKHALKSGRPVADVALDFGFCDQGHFTRVFRRWTGATPGTFARG
jgi:AraC-like DNA-binding protein